MKKHDCRCPHNKHHPRSLFLKLIIILLVTGIMVYFSVGIFYRISIATQDKPPIKNNITRYINYILADLGDPPSYDKARSLAADNFLVISYTGPSDSWSTDNDFPSIIELRRRLEKGKHQMIRTADTIAGARRGSFIYIRDQDQASIMIAADFMKHFNFSEKALIVLLMMLTGALLFPWIMIRKLLRPVKQLNKGVEHISRGDFDYKIPDFKHRDELTDLADSFNDMTERIREMFKAREQLMYDVSHELRSPLTRMKVALEFLPDDEHKRNITEDIRMLNKMLTEILESEKLNYDWGRLDKQNSDIVPLLREIIDSYNGFKPGIILKDTPESLEFPFDRERLKLVLTNILDNAMKYSPEDAAKIEISAMRDSDTININIRDYGTGIPEEELPFIFEPFYRVDKARTRETGGYGLGLSLCQKIVEAHGGQIHINSKLEEGTTIELELPAG